MTLARRSSRGGAVFHDLGSSSCFTFMAGKPEYDKASPPPWCWEALKQLEVEAFASGRNDLLVATRTGSQGVWLGLSGRPGIAASTTAPCCWTRISAGSPTTSIPTPKKLAARGISSVRSRVANLCELLPRISHERVVQALCEAFFAHHGTRVAPSISPRADARLAGLCRDFARQRSWEWELRSGARFQPPAGGALPLGAGWSCTSTWRGVIGRAQIFSDSLDPAPLDALAERLPGVAYRPRPSTTCCKGGGPISRNMPSWNLSATGCWPPCADRTGVIRVTRRRGAPRGGIPSPVRAQS